MKKLIVSLLVFVPMVLKAQTDSLTEASLQEALNRKIRSDTTRRLSVVYREFQDSVNYARHRKAEIGDSIRLSKEIPIFKAYLKKEYGQKMAVHIYNKEAILGMTYEMVKAAWGSPNDSRRATTNKGIVTTYFYNKGLVTFLNNKAISISEN